MSTRRKLTRCPDCQKKTQGPAGEREAREDEDSFEDWEDYADFLDRGDFPGLVRYCEQQASRYPDDPYSQYYLGDAYVRNGEYEGAIAFMAPHYRDMPDNDDFVSVILDALFALGRSEADFEWHTPPSIHRLDVAAADRCAAYLAGRRKARSAIQLITEVFLDGYVTFTEEALLDFLRADGRFVIDTEEGDDWAGILQQPIRSRD